MNLQVFRNLSESNTREADISYLYTVRRITTEEIYISLGQLTNLQCEDDSGFEMQMSKSGGILLKDHLLRTFDDILIYKLIDES